MKKIVCCISLILFVSTSNTAFAAFTSQVITKPKVVTVYKAPPVVPPEAKAFAPGIPAGETGTTEEKSANGDYYKVIGGLNSEVGQGADSDNATNGGIGFVSVTDQDETITWVQYNFGNVSEVSGDEKRFGDFLLNPDKSAKGFSFSRSWIDGEKASVAKDGKLGWFYGGSLTFTDWKDAQASPVTKDAPILALSGGFHYIMINKAGLVNFGADIGPAVRIVGGGASLDGDFKKRTLGKKDTVYYGGEVKIFAAFENVQPFLKLSWFPGDIEGFSGMRAMMGFEVMGTFATFDK